ncbi:MAG: hypothetical protein AAF490_27750 [Chloroflexota bacterium]
MYKTGIYQFDTGLLNQSRIPTRPLNPDVIDLPAMPRETAVVEPQYKLTGTSVRTSRAHRLSALLRLGSQKHPLCRNNFIQKVVTGYYHYERETHIHTCAIAAAFVGAFGEQTVFDPQFSFSTAVLKLSQHTGIDLANTIVTGPTGRRNSIAKEMMALVDMNWWTREAVADWLESIGL